MRFMVLVPASRDSEAGVMPSEELLAEMVKTGVLLAGEGLHPTSNGHAPVGRRNHKPDLDLTPAIKRPAALRAEPRPATRIR